jgi:hypothetical protein
MVHPLVTTPHHYLYQGVYQRVCLLLGEGFERGTED